MTFRPRNRNGFDKAGLRNVIEIQPDISRKNVRGIYVAATVTTGQNLEQLGYEVWNYFVLLRDVAKSFHHHVSEICLVW